MEPTITLLDTIIRDWKIITAAFAIGALYWQARLWFQKITQLLENTGNTHRGQNVVLDNIQQSVDQLDKRMAKLEGSLDLVHITNHEQNIKLAILETESEIINPSTTRKRRQRVQ